ncbi:hypothetical protein L1D13_23895 [Vibrio tubiashii]|uniref:hypothetical protein n=1 Tax=Vibrio tubiashii TaxID=29498 RepID=UPI001EFEB457|nr:hypothetical protein [Vibrio tubiashii]MCG9584614.1 hypothetical protein [Vibrio tubiashii]MCG9618142.1 hypothetical protein [Vibrio tubiashii]MCG9689948.1 hypothetical protein [Vibrio tubiashii]
MSLENIRLMRSMCQRVPFNVLKLAMREADISIPRGGIAVLQKQLEELALDKTTDPKTIAFLSAFYTNYLSFGDKTVSFASMEENVLSDFLSKLESIKCEVNKDSINYPYFDEDTDNILNHEQKLTDISIQDESVLLTFASLRALVETVEIDVGYFNQINAANPFPKELYDIKAKKKVFKRYYDQVFINTKTSQIELRLDTASVVSKKDLEESFRALQEAFVSIVRKTTKSEELKIKTANIFKAVPGSYEFSDKRVCELGFLVGDVIHHEKMRATKRDLRNELFHQGGKNNIELTKHDLTVFRIALRARKTFGEGIYETEAYMPGLAKMVASATPPCLNYVIISNCICAEDYKQHVESVHDYISKYEAHLLNLTP